MSIDPDRAIASPRGERGAAEAARYALLGLLLSGPSHGYDLSRRFSRDSAWGDVIHLSTSHLYALLTRLERDGFIAGEQQEAGARPQRRVYRLTDAGREAVLQWADDPVGHPRDMRIDFPIKLLITRQLGPERTSSLVERQRAVFRAYIDRLKAQPNPGASEDDAAFIDLMRTGRIGRAQAAIDWLDRCK